MDKAVTCEGCCGTSHADLKITSLKVVISTD